MTIEQYNNERQLFVKRFNELPKDKLVGVKVPSLMKEELEQVLTVLNMSVSDYLRNTIVETIFQRKSLIEAFNKSDTQKTALINKAVSVVDTYERDLTVSLPTELVNYETFTNSVLLERVSTVLSLNNEKEAYKFCMGIINIIDNLEPNSRIIFSETDSKGRISTKLVRNLFGNAIIFTLISALDRGHSIYTYTDTLKPVYVEDLFQLLSEGISQSIHERTKVYDNLFFEKYNKSHYNQWLQWTFGLSRREPIKEFNRLLRKNDQIAKPDTENEIEIRTNKAIENLKKRFTLFGLSEEGLKLAISRIKEFSRLYENYAYDYSPVKQCKNKDIHKILIDNKQSCPLNCGLKVN